MSKTEGQRRFELSAAVPDMVTPLPDNHKAIVNREPLFPNRVVRADRSPRVLVSGHNSKKIGKEVTVGAWKGMPIYTLTLAERTTCPASCHAYKTCYGNAMNWARRHLPGPELEQRLEVELREKSLEHPQGFVIRIHVLGDFYSLDYVNFWDRMFTEIPELHAWTYTALGTSEEPEHVTMAIALDRMNHDHAGRFHVRFSMPSEEYHDAPGQGGATVIDHDPGGRAEIGMTKAVVCPAEREKDTCCATCGLCWAEHMNNETIAFVLHGMGSNKNEKIARQYSQTDENKRRQIVPISDFINTANKVDTSPPRMLEIDPQYLLVDASYQRDFSRASISLVRRIVSDWDWRRFKPPIVCRDSNGYFIIDGQHTAIAAATHPDIDMIPVMVVEAETTEERALSFVGHNKDRVAVNAVQVFHAELVGKSPKALEIQAIIDKAGCKVLKANPPGGLYQPGETMAIMAVTRLVQDVTESDAVEILIAMREGQRAPIRNDELKAIIAAYMDGLSIQCIRYALANSTYESIHRGAQELAVDADMKKTEAMVVMYNVAAKRMKEAAE